MTAPASAPADALGIRPPAAAVLAALAEPNRLRLLRLLCDGERCVTECVEQTGMIQSLASKHLARLHEAGLVQRRQAGRHNYYSVVDPDGLMDLLEAAEHLATPSRRT